MISRADLSRRAPAMSPYSEAMSLTVQTLELTAAQERAARRINSAMAFAPRLKVGG